jgi:hypothetical protein
LCKDDFCAKTTFRRPLLCDGVYAGTPTAGIVKTGEPEILCYAVDSLHRQYF